MEKYWLTVVLSTGAGFLARLYMLRSDYRQYPGYPHGYVTHLSLGFIAAALGAVAIPALVEKEFTAVTFLALAAEQFREIRSMERESLGALEDGELVPRGKDYIEGIAKVFEARNYLVMLVSLATSAATQFLGWPYGVGAALVTLAISEYLMKGPIIGDIAQVVPAEPVFEGSVLKVEGIEIMNVGLPAMREKLLRDGLAVVIKPKDDNARATLHSTGQRQAIAHVAASILGTKKDVDLLEFTPLLRKDPDTGRIALFMVPAEKDMECLVEAVRRAPVLESARRAPLKTRLGRAAAD